MTALILLTLLGLVPFGLIALQTAVFAKRTSESLIRLNAHCETLAERTSSMRSTLATLYDLSGRRPDPFVCVLVEATIDLEGTPGLITMGTAGYVKNRNEKPLRLQSQVPLKEGRITVFCDLERVAVRNIRVGPHLLQSAIGECPVAHFDKLSIAEIISVIAEAADESTRAR